LLDISKRSKIFEEKIKICMKIQGAFSPVPNKFGNNKIHNIIKSIFAMVISSIPAAFALRKVISSIPAAFALKTAEIPSTTMIYFYMNMNLACNDFQLW
jgi:hypothetical protein